MIFFGLTLADKMAVGAHNTEIFGELVVDGLVFRKVVEAQVFRQLIQLLVGQLLVEELGHFCHLPAQVLRFGLV